MEQKLSLHKPLFLRTGTRKKNFLLKPDVARMASREISSPPLNGEGQTEFAKK